MQIKVAAVFPDGGFGFDGQRRRRDGDVFSIEESLFDPSWMEMADDDVEDEVAAPEEAPKAKAVRTGAVKSAKKAGK